MLDWDLGMRRLFHRENKQLKGRLLCENVNENGEILTRGKRVSKLSFWISRQVAVHDDF